ncbi:MAG: Lrp/AsnC family transcriptional regulator [Candidatus Woesearchaeota archaeon]
MISKKDWAITACLRHNARMKLTDMSRMTGIPVSTLFDRTRFPASLGITRFSALLDFHKLGFGTCATVLLKAMKPRRDKLRQHLLLSSHVNSLSRINNGYDFIAECIFRNMKELEEFCEKLEQNYGVREKQVHFVIEELKREGFLADETKGAVEDAWS